MTSQNSTADFISTFGVPDLLLTSELMYGRKLTSHVATTVFAFFERGCPALYLCNQEKFACYVEEFLRECEERGYAVERVKRERN